VSLVFRDLPLDRHVIFANVEHNVGWCVKHNFHDGLNNVHDGLSNLHDGLNNVHDGLNTHEFRHLIRAVTVDGVTL